MIEKIKIESRDVWLKLRQQDVTASSAACLLGIHEYQTIFSLFALKSGAISDEIEETPAMRRGLLLEPIALKLLREYRPDWEIKWNGTPGELGEFYYRDPEFRLGATPDCFVIDPKRGRGIVQVKTIESSIFRKKWFGDEDEAECSEMLPPLWTAVQANIEADLSKANWAAIAALVVGSGLDLHVIDVPLHAGVMSRVREAVTEFWRRVAAKEPPDPDFGRDGRTIAALYGEDNGLEIDLSGDNEIRGLLEERESLMAINKPNDARLEEIKAALKFKIGPNVAGYLPGWTLTNKVQHREEKLMAAASLRVLRVKRAKTGR